MRNRNTPRNSELKRLQRLKQRNLGNISNIRTGSPSNTLRRRPITKRQQSLSRKVGTQGGNTGRRPCRLEPFRLAGTRPRSTNRPTRSPPTYLAAQQVVIVGRAPAYPSYNQMYTPPELRRPYPAGYGNPAQPAGYQGWE